MASYENEVPLSGASDSAALSDTLRKMFEQPDEYFEYNLEPDSFYPFSLDEYADIYWINLPNSNDGPGDAFVNNDQQNLAPLVLQSPSVLQPQAVYMPSILEAFLQAEESVVFSHETTKAPNKRSENIEKVNPAYFYQPLPFVPTSWPANKETFQYNAFGELLPHLKFTPEEIMEFITENPGNAAMDGTYNGKISSLTLWIQTTPADSSRRYPNSSSDKCRFKCCPVVNNSIHKGSFRVAFDEWTSAGMFLDPYHCAGYVHLYCLEKFTPFSFICANFNVRPDDRKFLEGRNKMAITRDYQIFSRFVEKYIRIVSRPDFDHVREYRHTKTLCHKLVKTHLENEPKIRQKVREERGGNSLDIHMGDLMVYAEGERAKKAARDMKPNVRNSTRKRDEDDFLDMDDMFGSRASQPSKRNRT